MKLKGSKWTHCNVDSCKQCYQLLNLLAKKKINKQITHDLCIIYGEICTSSLR